jgi:hypothetical protein
MYTSSNEYRNFLRNLAKMDSSTYPQFDEIEEEIEDETLDELLYDTDNMSNYLDTVYSLTKKNPLFSRLYVLAAERMFSTDPEIGLAVMYSYDYLDLFFPLLYMYLREIDHELHQEFSFPLEPVDETNSYYILLMKFMQPVERTQQHPMLESPFPTQVRKV